MKTSSVICALLLMLPCIALASPIPDTGQTKCYDNTQEISCPSPGENFYGQDGNYSINPQSYTKLDTSGNELPDEVPSWVMVRDNVTGLIWENKTDDGFIHDKDNTYDWYDAQDIFIATLNSQNFGGHSDWRLPTIKELATLIDSSIPSGEPSINGNYFPNTGSHYYWSSTPLARNPSYAWSVYFYYAGDVDIFRTTYSGNVRAVRGGQYGLSNFIDIGNGTVTDTDTGLMWQNTITPGTYNWQQAISYCENLTLAGYDDWRLPNRNELQSIADYNRYFPASDPIFINGVGTIVYWSSTTYSSGPGHAWSVYFGEGNVRYYGKSIRCYVRAVRGGQCGSLDDSDGDTVCDDVDNCPNGYNPLQFDCDKDGEGDICDVDTIDPDGDGIDVECDNCINDYNLFQFDCDDDGQGDVCDGDSIDNDGDGVDDACDNCSTTFNPSQTNSDMDPYGDLCDNCPDAYNSMQEDTDSDNIGNACDPCPNDSDNDKDSDSICGDIDNCPSTPNSPALGTCIISSIGLTCTENEDCGETGYCSRNQEDDYPPGGNGIGDACDCEGNFNCDEDCDGSDAALFKAAFGRNLIANPCTTETPCNGDFNCDHDCDGTDAARFKQDFGRGSFQKPCPACVSGGAWCQYQ